MLILGQVRLSWPLGVRSADRVRKRTPAQGFESKKETFENTQMYIV